VGKDSATEAMLGEKAKETARLPWKCLRDMVQCMESETSRMALKSWLENIGLASKRPWESMMSAICSKEFRIRLIGTTYGNCLSKDGYYIISIP